MLAVIGNVSTFPADLTQSLMTNTNRNHGDGDEVSMSNEISEPSNEPADTGTVGEVTKDVNLNEMREGNDAVEEITESKMKKEQS